MPSYDIQSPPILNLSLSPPILNPYVLYQLISPSIPPSTPLSQVPYLSLSFPIYLSIPLPYLCPRLSLSPLISQFFPSSTLSHTISPSYPSISCPLSPHLSLFPLFASLPSTFLLSLLLPMFLLSILFLILSLMDFS